MRATLVIATAALLQQGCTRAADPVDGATYICRPDAPGRTLLATIRRIERYGAGRRVAFVEIADRPKEAWQPRIAFAAFDLEVLRAACLERTSAPGPPDGKFEDRYETWKSARTNDRSGVFHSAPADVVRDFRASPVPPFSGVVGQEQTVLMFGPSTTP